MPHVRRAVSLSEGLLLPGELLERFRAHAEAERPLEACGLLSGPDALRATTLHLARNAAGSPYRFDVHPEDLVRIVHEVEAVGQRVVAIVHSHPNGPARPSATDVREARWDALGVIVGDDGDARAWRIHDGEVEEVPIRATSPG